MFFFTCSIGCQKLMIRKVVLIKKKDFRWLCSVTGFHLLHDLHYNLKFIKSKRMGNHISTIKWAWKSKRYFPNKTSVVWFNYRDLNAEEKMNPFAEQEAWEEHQIGKHFLIIMLLKSVLFKKDPCPFSVLIILVVSW